jgi:hypothetical protein
VLHLDRLGGGDGMTEGRLPNLLVAGVPKAGTGSLFAYLTQHPEICGADEKEVGYFNYYNPGRHTGPPPPLDVYRRHFADWAGERYAVEATPTYSYGGRPVIDAVRTHLDHPRVIVSLRDPVERLWSAYTFQRELGNTTRFRDFEEYLEACKRRKRDGSDLVPRDHLHGLYIGFYEQYVPLWLDAFGADLRVIFAEDLFQDPVGTVTELLRWLDLDARPSAGMDLAARNPTQHPRSTRLAKIAYGVKRRGDRMGLLGPAVRRPLSRAYARLNAGPSPGRMSPGTRREVEAIYRESNRATAAALVAHGYGGLPTWLTAGDSADQPVQHRDA